MDAHPLTEGLIVVLTDARSIGYAMRAGRGWQYAAQRAAEREQAAAMKRLDIDGER